MKTQIFVLLVAIMALGACSETESHTPPPSEVTEWLARCTAQIAECEGDIYIFEGGHIARVDNLSQTASLLASYQLTERHNIVRVVRLEDDSLEYGVASQAYYGYSPYNPS